MTLPPEADEAVESEHRVRPIELFFDLVFVFAITQVTRFMADDPTWDGLGDGLLVLAVVWWAWVGYSWLTNVIDPEATRPRLTIFVALAAMLVASLAIPEAFGANAGLFVGRDRGRAGDAHPALRAGHHRPRHPRRGAPASPGASRCR